jgi:carboxypeptidase C (cathepsin A)
MSAFGPKRREGDGLAANPHSPLDAVDLVFIDPVGTGFSRVLPGGDGQPYWSRTGDGAAVKSVILNWLTENGRQESPRYLAGQSYGTVRAAVILGETNDADFDGVLLFALVGSAAGREMPFVTSLPTFAAAAWHYNRIDRAGRSVDEVFQEAVEFARTDYVTALIRAGSLPASERGQIARRMSSLIGLPAELIEENDLMIDKTTFMFELLREQNLRTGLLDVRVTAVRDTTRMSGRDDPALAGANRSDERSATRVRPPSSLETYFTRDLAFTTEERYIGVNFEVNSAWDWEDRRDVVPIYARAMRSDPDLRLFWAAGYFDLTTPAYAARYALDRTGIPADRLTAAYFPGAHSVFDEEANLAELAESVRRFVRGSDRSTGDGSFEGARSQLAPRTAHRPPNGLALHDVPLELERILAHRATILARHKGAH